MLVDASKNCEKLGAKFIVPPSIEDMQMFVQKRNANRYGITTKFLTPIKRYNSTHISDGGVFQKIADLNSENLLNIKGTCKNTAMETNNSANDLRNHEEVYPEPILNWDNDFFMTSEVQAFQSIL